MKTREEQIIEAIYEECVCQREILKLDVIEEVSWQSSITVCVRSLSIMGMPHIQAWFRTIREFTEYQSAISYSLVREYPDTVRININHFAECPHPVGCDSIADVLIWLRNYYTEKQRLEAEKGRFSATNLTLKFEYEV